jgi:ATP-binding cassette subfamily F protein 3
MYEGDAVKLLGRFLFRYQQVRDPVTALSGGERTRLQLLLIMLREPNCLILDEPTNHLDIDSLEVLEAELERFDGTVIFVSHDRYFLDRIADGMVVVSDGEAVRHTGGYSNHSSDSPPLASTPLRGLSAR